MTLSSWDWHKQVPRDMLGNLQFREALLTEAAKSPQLQKALIEVCSNDILFWIDTFGYQFNPDKREKGPFIVRPDQEIVLLGGEQEVSAGVRRYQHGILECIEDRQPVRIPKSRYGGATWLLCFTAVWMNRFHDNVKGLIMSKDEATAEDLDNPDSIFWKLWFIVEHLPTWMQGEVTKKKGVINIGGNVITSTANVDSAGVGGRATYMGLDEFGQFKKGHEIFSMTKDTSKCRIFIGTHKGRDTMLYSLCRDARYADMREIVLHWSHDPEKRKGLYRTNVDRGWEVIDKTHAYPPDFKFVTEPRPSGGPFPFLRSPWYDEECKGRSEYDIAMNLDIDPDGSSLTFFDGYEIGRIKNETCREPIWRGTLEYDKETGQPKKFVEDPLGKIKFWVMPTGEKELPVMRAGAFVDISSGTGATPSCLVAYSAITGEKVLSYEDANIFAPEFAMFCAALLRTIKDEKGTHPLLGWEIQGSATFAKKLREAAKYFPVYSCRSEDISGRPTNLKTVTPGVPTQGKYKLARMEEYRTALYSGRITNWDEHALDECLFWVYTAQGIEYRGQNRTGRLNKEVESGASIHHGDIVIADSGAYKMICELGFDKPVVVGQPAKGMPNPRTSGFREWLGEHQREDEEVWA